jgi:hypothetical protein
MFRMLVKGLLGTKGHGKGAYCHALGKATATRKVSRGLGAGLGADCLRPTKFAQPTHCRFSSS